MLYNFNLHIFTVIKYKNNKLQLLLVVKLRTRKKSETYINC